MKRLLFLVALLGVAIPAAAQISPAAHCSPPPALVTKAGAADQLASTLTPLRERIAGQLSERPVFLNVEGLEGARLAVRFLVDGSPWIVETLTVPDEPVPAVVAKSCAELSDKSSVVRPTKELRSGPALVELLARKPELLDRLHGMAGKDPERVLVEIRQDGQVVRAQSFAELRAESDELRRRPFRAQPVRSSVRGKGLGAPTAPASILAPKMTCEGLCQVQYEDCILNECGGAILCDTCEIQYQDCLDACSPPPPPPPPPSCTPKVEYFYDTYLVAVYPTGWRECYPDPWGYYPGVWHEEWVWVFRTDYVEKTTRQDCSVTYRLINYWYDYFYCYDWTFSYCYPPWYPWNTCY